MTANSHETQFATWNKLDNAVPLEGASHDEVVKYSVETIWRKAECIATLVNGNRVKLRDTWQFVGYSGRDPVRSLLFCHEGSHIEVRIQEDYLDDESAPAKNGDSRNGRSTFTAVDGSLITVAGRCQRLLQNLRRSRLLAPQSPEISQITR